MVGIIQTAVVFWEVSIGLGTSIELLSTATVHQLQKVDNTAGDGMDAS